MKIVITVISVLVIQLLLLVLFVNSGLYNVSTKSPDPGFLKWVFGTTSDNAAKHYSKNISVPNLTDSSMIVEGFKHYNDNCVTCHGAPGVKPSDIGKGLFPHPPNLVHSAKELQPARLFWVAKNGIKSTGMPGFWKTNSDRKIWTIISFIEKMKNMTPKQYAAMVKTYSYPESEAMKDLKSNGHKVKVK